MPDETHIAEDLHSFAQVLVWQVPHLRRGEHAREDATQELFLAGWQVYRDTGSVGLAKNRMASRQKNLFRIRREPKLECDLPEPQEGQAGPLEQDKRRGTRRDDPVEQAIYHELLARLPERRRRIVLLRVAGFSDRQIAEELGIGLRTVERELAQFRKDYRNEHAD